VAAKRLFRFHGRFADTVIAMSPWVAEGFASSRARVVVSPPGIPIPPWRERPARADHAPLRLLLVGTIDRRKRQEVAVEALIRLTSAGVDVRLEVVGRAADENYAAELREVASSAGVSDRRTRCWFPVERSRRWC
jgi:glycosyltransferase involved in cell wall biosynthesis